MCKRLIRNLFMTVVKFFLLSYSVFFVAPEIFDFFVKTKKKKNCDYVYPSCTTKVTSNLVRNTLLSEI